MGSMVMHLCAAFEANKQLKLDKNKFMVGSIAPDINKLQTGSRQDTHYIVKKIIDGKEYELPDLERFVKENKEKIVFDPYAAGYYCHLIADEIWFRDIMPKYVDVLSDDKNSIKLVGQDEFIPYKEYQDTVYDDYSKINNFLLEKYNVDIDYLYNIAVLGIDNQDFQKMIHKNLEYIGCEAGEKIDLKLIDMNDIVEWIETSKNITIENILKLR